MEITRQELKKIDEQLDRLCDDCPQGLRALSFVLQMASVDIKSFLYKSVRLTDLQASIDFAKTIPMNTDMDSPEVVDWMLHSREFMNHPAYI